MWSNVFKTQFYSKIPETQDICYFKAACPRRSPHVGLDVYNKKYWHDRHFILQKEFIRLYTQEIKCKL